MKRVLIAVMAGLLLFSAAALFAGENFAIDTKINAAFAVISGPYIVPSAMFTYNIKPFGLGGELKYAYNFTNTDSYLLALGIMRFSVLYAGAGAVFKLTSGERAGYLFARPESDVNLALTGGLIARPIPLGPGKLGFNASLDLYPSDTPVIATKVSDPSELIGSIFATGLVAGINSLLNAVKLNFGVNYTIRF